MDRITKALDDYLEEKRMEFARFYFISNDELLNLLSEQAKMHEMQKYLGSVFEGIHRLNIDDELS
jgi:dynein heavy chain